MVSIPLTLRISDTMAVSSFSGAPVAELVEAHDVLVFSYILSSISSVGEQTQLANEVILFVPEES